MATTTSRTNLKMPKQASILIDSHYPIEGASWLETVCDAYVELGRLAVIAMLLGLTSFIITYVVKNQSLSSAVTSEPLAIETTAETTKPM